MIVRANKLLKRSDAASGGAQRALLAAFEDWRSRNEDVLFSAAVLQLARCGVALTYVSMPVRWGV